MIHSKSNQIRILIVCSNNSGKIAPFIIEQAEALIKEGVKLEYYGIKGKGLRGYLSNRKMMLKKIEEFEPHLIHAHYGLSGLFANMQRKIPVVTTYHGSDINDSKVFWLSKLSMLFSKHNIFVSERNLVKAKVSKRFSLLPCGVDMDFFKPVQKEIARKRMNLLLNEKYVLFSSSFNNFVKNASLAQQAIELVDGAHLVELKNYSREEVWWLMNAVDACIMTSYSEGSPQFIKEALACNCPIVSVNVGDVSEVISNIDGCFIADYDPVDIAGKLNQALKIERVSGGRERLIYLKFDNQYIASRLHDIYCHLLE
ncbi:MAG: glycosyltransferase family 4 protein [Paludibacter sp.]|nr:glycosyltransferase family 4 protein [Paludibacter sp.]